MIETRLAISFMAATASTPRLAAFLRVGGRLLAIYRLSALSAFCLMLETISSIEEDASSAEAACELAPLIPRSKSS